jgi:nicotinate-nucleotide adenylyltransferase
MSLLTWKNPEAILQALTKLYVVPRIYGYDDYLKQEREILKLNPNLEVHYLADHPYKNISSTDLRK